MIHRPRSATRLALASAVALASLGSAACGRAHGVFGFSAHPFAVPQLEKMLGDWPNPGPNPETVVRDAAGNSVAAPTDRGAYAARLVAFVPGRPPAIIEASHPREALGLPDHTANIREPPHAVSLGNGGSITLELTGSPLGDSPGPDLFVFEAGPSREAVSVEISPDGASWTAVGEAPGGFYALDIASFVKPGDTFRFIRLTDVADSGGDNEVWPGAEIDAVAALPPAQVIAPTPAPERISIPSEVLFGFDSDVLGTGAPAELDSVSDLLARRPEARLSIEGHTDDIGDDTYNLALSERRAAAVKVYLVHKGVDAGRVEARGFGETRPVVPNADDTSRRRNRRVELVVTGGP